MSYLSKVITNNQSQIVIGGSPIGTAKDIQNQSKVVDRITRFDNAEFIHTYTKTREI